MTESVANGKLPTIAMRAIACGMIPVGGSTLGPENIENIQQRRIEQVTKKNTTDSSNIKKYKTITHFG